MNAPLDRSQLEPAQPSHEITLDDKWTLERGRAFMTGTQALIRLPMLQRELDQQAARNRARSYRPAEDLDPEFDGLPLDPDPVPGAPFLFTIAGLADESAAALPALPPLTEEAKIALRQEVALADEYANMVGREICGILLRHRIHIQAAISQHVEPQIEALLAELTESLDSPFDPDLP